MCPPLPQQQQSQLSRSALFPPKSWLNPAPLLGGGRGGRWRTQGQHPVKKKSVQAGKVKTYTNLLR